MKTFLWHQHLFTGRDGGTQIDDLVEYAVPGGALVNRLWVRRDLNKVFGYRGRSLERIFQEEIERHHEKPLT